MDTSGPFPALRQSDPLYEMADYTMQMRSALTPTAWTQVTLTNGWSHWTASGWSGVRVSTMGRLVMITGAAGKASWPNADLMATLPIGLRPPFQVQGQNCQVAINGNLTIGGAASAATSFGVNYFAA